MTIKNKSYPFCLSVDHLYLIKGVSTFLNPIKTLKNLKTNLHIFKRLQSKDINNSCACQLSL